ncbi:phosphoribosylaminoimidazolesuccinocarboxamide synthase [Polaribacter sargassicola]|uniref:phosphoribosylaminoimidazolesuccinocarboxamide synthase n=1 Tax=Polaribacter sargassicola TaxID=2836891 RepID=UPI001F246C35|nr:phosphoribosylaminoimidazolesuccinocarboxamide synthase [Polaribacter sp. DS7-9]MCG1034995.1 phosphoribosylaminoimidazolesuccinocarboxamide synthase [Polaribacter sp. DS7-9]
MQLEKRFKTKTGFCHVLIDKIVISRDGIIGNVASVSVGNSITKILLIYAALSLFLLYSAFISFQKEEISSSVFFSVFGLYLIFGIFRSLNNSATSVIDKNKIKKIKFKKAILGLTCSRFIIYFEDENGSIKRRLIMLPGLLKDGQNETEKAKKIMQEEFTIK